MLMNLSRWTKEEEQILFNYYGKISAREINKSLLPERSVSSIKFHAKKLGISGNQAELNKKYHIKSLPSDKVCKRCKQNKDISQFRRWITNNNQRADWFCVDCRRQYERDHYNHSDKHKRQALRNKERIQTLRAMIVAAYGNKCACPKCPETNIEFLTIEHVNGNGNRARAKLGYVKSLQEIIDKKFPPEYTILCYNCNCAKAHKNLNICPHLLQKNESIIPQENLTCV